MLDWLFGRKRAAAEQIRNKKKEDVPGPVTQADPVHTTVPAEQAHARSSEPPAPTAFPPQEPAVVPPVTAPGATPEIESIPQETAQPPEPLTADNFSDWNPQTSPEYSEVTPLGATSASAHNDEVNSVDAQAGGRHNGHAYLIADEKITELKPEKNSFSSPATPQAPDAPPAAPVASTFGKKYSPPKVEPSVSSSVIEAGISPMLLTPVVDNEAKTLAKAGDQSVAIAHPRCDKATIVRVQAGGRRIIVRAGSMIRAYSCRRDGTYRLDGAPDKSPAQLLLDRTMACFKSANSSFKPLPAALSRLKGGAPAKMAVLASSAPLQRGEVAIAAAHPRYDKVQIVGVQACGRRVIVSFGTGTRAYSRRKDTSYRLEGAPNSSTSQLIINATLDEIMLRYRNNSLMRYKPKPAEA